MDTTQFILKMLAGTPIWVWFVFAYLMHIGIKSLTPQIIYLPKLFIMPIVLTVMKYKAFYSGGTKVLVHYIIGIVLGIIVGGIVAHKDKIKVIDTKLSVEIPGSSYTIILMILHFCCRYFFGYHYARHAELYGQIVLFDSLVSSIFAGFFLGRAIIYVNKYKKLETII